MSAGEVFALLMHSMSAEESQVSAIEAQTIRTVEAQRQSDGADLARFEAMDQLILSLNLTIAELTAQRERTKIANRAIISALEGELTGLEAEFAKLEIAHKTHGHAYSVLHGSVKEVGGADDTLLLTSQAVERALHPPGEGPHYLPGRAYVWK